MKKAKILRFICSILSGIFLLGFVSALLWYRHGSFEMIPTDEQQGKTQIMAILFMIVSGVLCGTCIVVRRVCKIISSDLK